MNRCIAAASNSRKSSGLKPPLSWTGSLHGRGARAWPDGSAYGAKWFIGGKLNLSHNCVDRHANGARRDKVALLWEGEPGEVRKLTYADLHAEVQRFANVLKDLGIRKGDRVAIYMGMCPELAIALLACARIGAVHSVIFGGFAAHAIVDRVNDSACVAVITQDTSFRRGTEIQLKKIVDEALDAVPDCARMLLSTAAAESPVTMKEGRDVWWDESMLAADKECPAEWMDAEDPLYLLYTSGTTGKPKGLVHTTGGYSVQTYLTSKYVFDLQEDDVYWCTADIGWVTGHSYVVYGPLQNGATVMMYEGAPNWPENDRFWKIVDAHKVTIFYTAPTAIRAFTKWGTSGSTSTRSRRCGCSARWASRSIPRRGCGSTAKSARSAARSSTPAGRPRRVPS